MRKKGQAAIEFLMTYGWAFLIIIVVIMALVMFGVLSPGNWLPDKCDLGQGLQCLESVASITNPSGDFNISISVQNALGQNIKSITIQNFTPPTGIQCRSNNTITNFYDGTTGILTINCTQSNIKSGQKINGDLVVLYVSENNLMHKLTGKLIIKVG